MLPQKLTLSRREEAEIRKFMTETKSKEEYRRAEAALYKAEGLSYRAIAKRMNAAYLSVYKWIQRYKEGGVNALRTKTRPGKKPRITPEQRKAIVQTALQSPQAFGYLKNEWSVRLLAKHLTQEMGIRISKTHVWEILQELGIVYKRAKAVVESPDPEYPEKARRVEGYKKIAPALLKKGLQ